MGNYLPDVADDNQPSSSVVFVADFFVVETRTDHFKVQCTSSS